MEEGPWYETVPIPALLRHARTTYGKAMRAALEAAGYDDIPANGLYIIGGLSLSNDVPLRQLVKELGISKQGAGQLVDALVMRGYLARNVDARDRRQLIVALTERGRAAADVQREAREQIDATLRARVGDESVREARRALGALIEIDHEEGEST
ncbi:MAG TPA: MarR family transcriptional regulator [Sphingomicrobium sp.]|nr:MarR family transcriptional regulator [Sphingomicrobium sp.]